MARMIFPYLRQLTEGKFTLSMQYLLSVSCLVFISASAWLIFKRKQSRRQLSSGNCRLPTITWMPKFVNYMPELDDHSSSNHDTNLDDVKLKSGETKQKKMPSSNITNILPRMERLNGPYGIYATVYGVSTKVIHIAHPIPAKAILMGKSSDVPILFRQSNKIVKKSERKKRSSVADNLGAIKNPAYNHFKNFSGDGVFTADGITWKAKRTSVLHCLLKGCTKDESEESLRLEREANIAADNFLSNSLSKGNDGNSKVNIVPLLQRATIGLIYRFISHHDVDTHYQSQEKVQEVSSCRNSADGIVNFGENNDETQNKIGYTLKGLNDSRNFDASTSNSSNSSVTDDSSTDRSVPIQNLSEEHEIMNNGESDDCNPFEFLSAYLEAITNIRMIILAQSRSIWFLLPQCFYRAFSSMYKEEEKQMKTIRRFARIACRNAKIGSPLQMLRSRQSHNPEMKDDIKNGDAINKELLDEAITLLFAGQDTSAATLSWTLHLLSLNPSIQQRVSKEVNESLSNEGLNPASTKRITKKMVSKMSYLDAVIKESMRLFPVAPFVVRKIPEEVTIPGDPEVSGKGETITFPKDTFACIWIYSLHRNQKLWHRPNDFVPERWLDPNLQKMDAAQNSHKGAFMPFAAGPRNCVGQPLAHNILRIMLARIMNECQVMDDRLNHYETTLTEEEAIQRELLLRKDMQAGFTVLPVGGVRIFVKRRMKIE